MKNKRSLILTLAMERRAQDFFDHLRAAHFPPERNYLKAHLTLFHQLPGSLQVNQKVFTLRASGLISLVNGVAVRIESGELLKLHRKMQSQMAAQLIPQDRQAFRPHITIQNKVTPETARELLARLSETFEPFEFKATGLQLWRYLDGPWELVQTFSFKP